MASDVLSCRCRHCGENFPYLKAHAGAMAECPRCKGSVQLPGNLQAVASIVSRRKNSGASLALEITGFALLFFPPWGLAVGIVLIVLGYRRAYRSACSQCDTPVANASAARCPTCKAAFLSDE